MLSEQLIDELKGAIEQQLSKLALNSKEFLTFSECSQYTDMSPNFLRQQIQEGLPSYKVGGRRTFFKRKEVDDWVTKNRVVFGGNNE
ncbi:hypothetical protein N474_12455 [Pseudoalteromonas luteoviolacea CPMOR-2]|uniref:helix-turn-helix transcriptional regulator n=1 Tax=Pseudoalteromonas luteoviolacea TaxID=43657 RepID=UPI0007B16CDA|nr:helix-turn-helix domain-containing protein [Pseudoalteromonas luteoviolacea]KZN56084.1 hypothetical protein N474_12455 [Pseudoalteromonas luteoviolacea CPMOR-2]